MSYASWTSVPPSNKQVMKQDTCLQFNLKNIDSSQFELYQEERDNYNNRAKTMTEQILEVNPVNDLFFSKSNVKRLQKRIKKEVFRLSKGKIVLDAEQDESDLLIAMRAVYLEEGKNLPTKVVRQVKLLNNRVMDYIMPDLMSNIKLEYGYLRDINEPLKPINRPIQVNTGRYYYLVLPLYGNIKKIEIIIIKNIHNKQDVIYQS